MAAVCSVTACRAEDPLRAPSKDGQSQDYGLRLVRNVAYRDYHAGEDETKNKNKLDLYLPRTKRDFPVLFFIHGGAWIRGDKDEFGIYSTLGMFLARRGIGAVFPNYRLSPGVRHPEHIKDVARAFAWTYKNIPQYGGRPDQIFVGGHSAGGHLAALLATDERYLKAVGLSLSVIKGAVPISGVFRLHDFELLSAGMPTVPGSRNPSMPRIQGRQNLLSLVFGSDAKDKKEASPISHVHQGLPPFLIIYADSDMLGLPQMAREFDKALQKEKCDVTILEVKKRNHLSVIINAPSDEDPVAVAVKDFIARHTPAR
jgi:acetyl esterase/lipase